jgi:integrase
MTQLGELKGPKTRAGIRDVPIPAHLVEILRQWVDRHFIRDGRVNDRNLVFLTRGRQAYRPSLFLENWRQLLGRAGLLDKKGGNQFHFHALRHFAASWMIESGMSLLDVASVLGHEKFDMTLQVYAHPITGGNHRHAVVQRFAASLLAPVIENTLATAS